MKDIVRYTPSVALNKKKTQFFCFIHCSQIGGHGRGRLETGKSVRLLLSQSRFNKPVNYIIIAI